MAFMQKLAGAALGAALLFGSGLLASQAQAGYVVTLQEVGGDVVATGRGPIDLTGLFPFAVFSYPSFLAPDFGSVNTGPAPLSTAERTQATAAE
jgi:hypothetical protein